MRNPNNPDREGVTQEKSSHFFKVISPRQRKLTGLLGYFPTFRDIDLDQVQHRLRTLSGDATRKIEHLLLDVDACLAPPYEDVLPENFEKIAVLQRSVRLGIYSNCKTEPRHQPLIDLGLSLYEGQYPKPDPRGFLEACDQFGFNPATTAMAGDNPNTDGGAHGVLAGAILVKPISSNLSVIAERGLKKSVKFFGTDILRSISFAAVKRDNPELFNK